jgi:beta-lactamase superfamily II metal-dependent hydrolase
MTTAERIIIPTKAGIFRSVFIYTGQGESTLLVIPTGPSTSDYMYVLVDCDRDKEKNEVDLVEMFNDLFKNSGELHVFINTHPHNDHIGGIKDVYDEVGFAEVWHSNHNPGPKHKEKYEDLKYVIEKVGKKNEYFLLGSNDLNKVRSSDDEETIKKLGNIDYQVLSPAEYLCNDINEENQDTRDDRIHEQCGVIKFTYGKTPKSIMITGDSDKVAWKDHITKYHKKNLPSYILSASHHGSRTFFKCDKDDKDIYEAHIETIKPTYLIISAPKQKDSPHGHPHDDAMELYKKHVGEDDIFHLGSGPYSVIVDIDEEGNIELNTDTELIKEYGKGDDEDGGDDKKKESSRDYSSIYVGSQTTRLDKKPMG